MSVVYSLIVRDNRLTQVVNAIDGAGTSGSLLLLNTVGAILSTLQLARPCGNISGGVLVFSGMSLIDPAAAQGGIATAAAINDGNGTNVISGLTVGISTASDIVMSPTSVITAGQTVAITSATITGN